MTDLTPILAARLDSQGAKSLGGRPFSLEQINDFLREAYQINSRARELLSYLRSIRQPYLSTAPAPRRRRMDIAASEPVHLTDTQRDQVDAEAKSVLRDLNAALSTLARAEQVRQETETMVAQKRRGKGSAIGALGRWAAGGGSANKSPEEELEEARANGIKAHREGVIWFLQRQLERCGQAQTSMMEIRLKRQTERSESALYESKGSSSHGPVWEDRGDDAYGSRGTQTKATENSFSAKATALSAEELDRRDGGQQNGLDDEQMQVFARENQDLLKHYEQKIDQVRTAEQSLIEISELQSTLATNLEIQATHIDQLIQDSFLTTENVGTGNKELKKASERKSTAKMVFYGTIGLCFTLIVWDLIF